MAEISDLLAVSYDPGYIVLSYMISVMGCVTSLEMLHRRTSRSGLLNWYLLLTSAISMGGIGIWCMHFIGNRAIILGNGDSRIQISYNMAFTGISFALPVCVLLLAFYTISFQERAPTWLLLIGGLLAGTAVCAMHYVGQLGISNYICSYHPGYVVGSAIIATFAATLALSIFFRWRASWTDSWWRRAICGILLAGAVSGMHWTATAGTNYRNKPGHIKNDNSLSRKQTVIACSVLSGATCVLLLVLAIIAGHARRRSTVRAGKLVLTCAYFDSAGRVMVTPQALLPAQEVVERYVVQDFRDDEFSETHPAFLWAFRASRNWIYVKDLIPSMKLQLQANHALIKQQFYRQREVVDGGTMTNVEFDNVFKQLFCVSAQNLANELHQPLEALGELYPEVLETTTPSRRSLFSLAASSERSGQQIFTVRRLNRDEADHFAASGFRFAPIERIAQTLSERIQISSVDLNTHLHAMFNYSTTERGYTPGIHLVAFVMRPTVHKHFEVLTRKGSAVLLPSSQLPLHRLSPNDMDILDHMDEWTLSACIQWLRSASTQSVPDVGGFRRYLYRAIMELSSRLPKEFEDSLRFCARPINAPCRKLSPSDPDHCTLLTFRGVVGLDSRLSDSDLVFSPLRSFRVQEQANDTIGNRGQFLKDLNEEFSYSAQAVRTIPEPRARLPWRFLTSRRDKMSSRDDSQESLVRNAPLGDIIVLKEVQVNVAESNAWESQQPVEPETPSTTMEIKKQEPYANTCYIDELYNTCFSPDLRMKHSTIHRRSVSEGTTYKSDTNTSS